jgi:hypothetical protein
MLNQFRTQYLEAAAGKFNQWLASHNLPRWSVPVGWAVAVVPAIAVAHYDIPPPVVSLLAVSGFVGLLSLSHDSSVNSSQLLEGSSDFDPAEELQKQEIDSKSESSLEVQDSVIPEEDFQDDPNEDDSEESSLNETKAIANEESNHYVADSQEERFVTSNIYRN